MGGGGGSGGCTSGIVSKGTWGGSTGGGVLQEQHVSMALLMSPTLRLKLFLFKQVWLSEAC